MRTVLSMQPFDLPFVKKFDFVNMKAFARVFLPRW